MPALRYGRVTIVLVGLLNVAVHLLMECDVVILAVLLQLVALAFLLLHLYQGLAPLVGTDIDQNVGRLLMVLLLVHLRNLSQLLKVN